VTERVSTGIRGLDPLLEGGFPKGSTILVTGTPGSAKSTFGLQFLVAGALQGEKGIYISLEEEPEGLIQQSEQLGLEMSKLIADHKIWLFKMEINLVQGEEAIRKILDPDLLEKIKHFGAKRLVVDSLTLALHLSHNYQLGPRGATASMMQTFKKMGCTTLFIHERETGEETDIHYGFQDFVCDGIIFLQLIRKKEAAEFYRGITILKMRKTNHGKGVYPFHIELGGIRVFPDQRVF
jgi:KaiC/GvpD/RAD55 family RecA-like ATPase